MLYFFGVKDMEDGGAFASCSARNLGAVQLGLERVWKDKNGERSCCWSISRRGC